ncbi:MAG: response regulator [Myxococcaceae bacterium]
MSAGRILVIDPDSGVLSSLEEDLVNAGFEVESLSQPTLAVARAAQFRPDLVLVEPDVPLFTGPELIRAMRAFPSTQPIPVAFMAENRSEAALLRWIHAGAVDVVYKPLGPQQSNRIGELVRSLQRTPWLGPSAPDLQIRTLLNLFRNEVRTGTLRLNPGTPFEGRAAFVEGRLTAAAFGNATGLKAIEEMLGFDDGVWRFEPTLPSPDDLPRARSTDEPTETIRVPEELRPKLLLVDDDPDLRKLFTTQLTRAGFSVEVAEDGRDGWQAARTRDFDVIVADLNMPRLDGWGMLRQLRSDFRTRETPVIFLSAHDDYRDTLRAARSGAWDYLPKTGRADQVCQRALKALEPRREARAVISQHRAAVFEAEVVGPRWLVRELSEQQASGVLDGRDEWFHYRMGFRDGHLVFARASTGQRDSTALNALGAFLVSRKAQVRFEPGVVVEPGMFEQSTPQLLDAACLALSELQTRVLTQRLSAQTTFEVDPELYGLFCRISSEQSVRIARAVCEERIAPQEVPQHLTLPFEDVEVALLDLVRRRVLKFVDQ